MSRRLGLALPKQGCKVLLVWEVGKAVKAAGGQKVLVMGCWRLMGGRGC